MDGQKPHVLVAGNKPEARPESEICNRPENKATASHRRRIPTEAGKEEFGAAFRHAQSLRQRLEKRVDREDARQRAQ